MRVKISDKIYDSNDQLIMLILEDDDKRNISRMALNATKYCSYPDEGFTEDEINDFMKTE